MKLKSLLDEFSHGGMSDCEPMNEEDTKMFLSICMMNMQGEMPDEAKQLVEEGPCCRIAQGRMDQVGVKPDVATMLMLSVLCKGNPGNAVLWAYTMCHIAEKNGNAAVTFDDFVQAFPMGYPNARVMLACWDGQKRKSEMNKGITDNKMDSAEYWKLGVPYEEPAEV